MPAAHPTTRDPAGAGKVTRWSSATFGSRTVGIPLPVGGGNPRTICQKSGASSLPSQSARLASMMSRVMRNGNSFAFSGLSSAGDLYPS